jgi:hypothetical protein
MTTNEWVDHWGWKTAYVQKSLWSQCLRMGKKTPWLCESLRQRIGAAIANLKQTDSFFLKKYYTTLE